METENPRRIEVQNPYIASLKRETQSHHSYVITTTELTLWKKYENKK